MLRILSFFILIAISLVACKKKEYQLGSDLVDQNNILGGISTDTFDIVSYSIEEDSVISDNAANVLLGSYNDPLFGSFDASFYTQFRLAGVDPNFGDPSTIVIDSFVLGLEYLEYYGDFDPQTFEVYELQEAISIDSTYYSFSTVNHSGVNLVPFENSTITPNPLERTIIGSDTVSSQLRIYLDTNLARSLINEATSGSTTFSSNDEFLEFFKGLYITTNNPIQAQGEGAVYYFDVNDPSSKATIYFHQDTVATSYDLLINSDCADFSNVQIENSGSAVDMVIQDSTQGNQEFYAQAFKHRAALSIPGLANLPENIIIHRADLELPVQFQTGHKYQPGGNVSVATRADSSSTELLNVGVIGIYDDNNKRFNVNIREYAQAIANKTFDLTELVFSPLYFINSAERIVFNGKDTINKDQPRLVLTYTTY
tara:strand:- start:1505 stop:2785 length:1281 start_codon:yes stop_codon:yes gene_type:complete